MKGKAFFPSGSSETRHAPLKKKPKFESLFQLALDFTNKHETLEN